MFSWNGLFPSTTTEILYIFNSFQFTPDQVSTDCDIGISDKRFNNFWKLSSNSSPNVSEVFVKKHRLNVITMLAFSGLESLKIFRSITLLFFELYTARTSRRDPVPAGTVLVTPGVVN